MSFLAQLFEALKSYWIIPAGMVALYYYGWYHFNTPDFDLTEKEKNSDSVYGRLLTLAPPIFTTARSRFNRFARRYVLILEVAFLVITLLPGVVLAAAEAARVPDFSSLFNADSVQQRAFVALFALTGLLSSFPIFKEIDAWILGGLHRMAQIPDDARIMALTLKEAQFVPSPESKNVVRELLGQRDTIRVADERATGDLERSLLRTLWLKAQLVQATTKRKYQSYKVRLQRDLSEIDNIADSLRDEFIAFFKDQERLVPADAPNIDAYIAAHDGDPHVHGLRVRRQALKEKCDTFYSRLCLLAALSIYATHFTPESVNDGLKSLGFKVDVEPTPVWDWDSVVKVVSAVFVIWLGFSLLFQLLAWLLHWNNPYLVLPRTQIVMYTILATLAYAVVVLIAIRFKRHWARQVIEGTRERQPGNPLIGFYAYLVTAIYFVIVWWGIYRELSVSPLLYALNYGVVAYFLGIYVDRSLANSPKSAIIAAWQAGAQFLATAIAAVGPLPVVANFSARQILVVGLFSALLAAVTGFAIGIVFQRTYRRTDTIGRVDKSARTFGDMKASLSPL